MSFNLPSDPVSLLKTVEGILSASSFVTGKAHQEALVLLKKAFQFDSFSLWSQDSQKARPEDLSILDTILSRRVMGEPLSRIIGKRGFWDDDFLITPDVLDPRPETEGIIEHALQLFSERSSPLIILEGGTGSGCLLLSLLGIFPQAFGVGIDICDKALTVAKRNAKRQ